MYTILTDEFDYDNYILFRLLLKLSLCSIFCV